MSFQILGTGSFLPEKVITNEDLSRMVDTSDEWITKRVGVKERHVCTTESNTDMAAKAAGRALEAAGVSPEELDLIIGTSVSADSISPGMASMVQNRLGAKCPAFDINAACPGFLFGLEIASGFFARGTVKKVLSTPKLARARAMGEIMRTYDSDLANVEIIARGRTSPGNRGRNGKGKKRNKGDDDGTYRQLELNL
jgi:3-oxoacyl-(acyl-carrier-protein) synthase III